MTWGNPPKFKSDPPKPGKKITPEDLAKDSEHSHQTALFAWAALSVDKYPKLRWMFAIPNGGLRDMRTAVNLKAEGVKAGVPDIFLPIVVRMPRMIQGSVTIDVYSGLFIEMKVKKNKTSKEQDEYIEYLKDAGYYCVVCYTWSVARDAIIAYLEGRL
jgi:hypothetical protein